MRGPLLNLPAVARALGFVVVAIAIVAAATHFHATPPHVELHSAGVSTAPDVLSDALKRCQLIADQAKDDAACEAAWAENRRRFKDWPTSVTRNRRLDRSINRTPNRASSPAMRRLSFDFGWRNARPAAANPPWATTSAK